MNLVDRERVLGIVALCAEVAFEQRPECDHHVINALGNTIIRELQDESMLPIVDPIKANQETQDIIDKLNIGKES